MCQLTTSRSPGRSKHNTLIERGGKHGNFVEMRPARHTVLETLKTLQTKAEYLDTGQFPSLLNY